MGSISGRQVIITVRDNISSEYMDSLLQTQNLLIRKAEILDELRYIEGLNIEGLNYEYNNSVKVRKAKLEFELFMLYESSFIKFNGFTVRYNG